MNDDEYNETVSIILSKSEDEEELTIEEMIEEFEEKIDFLNINDEKKDKLRDLVNNIKLEKNEKSKKFLFKELVKLANQNE